MSERDDDKRLSWLEGRLRDGVISRREFMGRAAALGVTTALATTMASHAIAATGRLPDAKIGSSQSVFGVGQGLSRSLALLAKSD